MERRSERPPFFVSIAPFLGLGDGPPPERQPPGEPIRYPLLRFRMRGDDALQRFERVLASVERS